MQDRDDHALPEQSASSEENTGLETGKKTIAKRRKSVGVIRDADPARLKALEYLGRRWLSLR
ncbi:hypothetical protein GHK78_29650 [Sinorhizobium meliloti]|uniref:hypothetical protein n=1 Tax=Rhizobium meliloti TaxID=382 RepID=UPI0002E98A36|nr:hypothetical protein [Sinorhizobium meliloti]MDE3874252.1 hypothetical protein [Sinorhizobium meliloti]MQX67106.1 hypothetical protein [Sinorhizobium meliloti]